MKYTPTIGLEVHAELKTKSKMFCGCKNDPHGGEPNTHTCPICLAHPGTLPVPNESAIEKVLLFGQAVGATAANYSEFDRKNYFYPDIPKAYQISQYAWPFLTGGMLEGVELTRVHLEEDTARSVHDRVDGSLVDFNRAGVPLMELVTEPVIHDAKTAGAFARELQILLRTLGISDANMERGEMRVEANISVSADPDNFGTKVEVKNLNSFKSVEGAIAYEIERQIALIEAGEEVKQETRGWNENKLTTFSQRSKETAKDYRYFPDPDIPKIIVSEHEQFSSARLAEIMPKLPSIKREEYRNLGLTSDIIDTLMGNLEIDTYFQSVVSIANEEDTAVLKLAANYLTSDVVALMTSEGKMLAHMKAEHFLELATMLVKNEINSRVGKDILPELFGSNTGPRELATARNLLQISDVSALTDIIVTILKDHPEVVAEYKAGKVTAIQFLVGQGMKRTRGSANPETLKSALEEALAAA